MTVGVIVRMEKETFKVLSQHGKELSVPQHTVQPRKTRAVALDCHQVSVWMGVGEHMCVGGSTFSHLELHFS